MLDKIRNLLFLALVAVVFFLYQSWNKEFPTSSPNVAETQQAAVSDVPTLDTHTSALYPAPNHPALDDTQLDTYSIQQKSLASSSNKIHVETDVFDVTIDTLGGSIVGLKLKQYPLTVGDEINKVRLFQEGDSGIYMAQGGLQGPMGPDTNEGQALYVATQTDYVLSPDAKTLTVTLTNKTAGGLSFLKSYIFERGSYLIQVKHQVVNNSDKPWQGRFYGQLKRNKEETKRGMFAFPTYTGGAISSPDKRFEKISFEQIAKESLNRQVTDGWVAMVQHYFVTAWIPPRGQRYDFYTSDMGNGLYRIGMVSPWVTVAPGKSDMISTQLYAGPEDTDLMSQVAPGLELTVDYGWFWPISQGLFWVMKHLHALLGNWGLTIIAVTMLIKAAFYNLSASSYRSMANMRKVQPKLNALKERYGDDRQKMSQAMMELYKKEKINPLGGCLPILIQIPVFIALYWVLIESVELRQAPFYGWIHDLSVMDPYYVLPVIMGATMLLQQRLSPAPPDPIQAKIMMAMPIVFTGLFYKFPAGLMLYWVVNNSLSILQQWMITRSIENTASKNKKTKK